MTSSDIALIRHAAACLAFPSFKETVDKLRALADRMEKAQTSDIMLFGVLRMPFDMAMNGNLSQHQYWQRGQQAADTIESLQARIAELEAAPSQPEQNETEKLAALMQGLELPPTAINMPVSFFLETGKAIASQAKQAQPQGQALTDDEIADVLSKIDYSQMVTADDVFYLIARAIIAASSKDSE